MRTEQEINSRFEELNKIAKDMQTKHCVSNIPEFIAYTHTIQTLLWVLGEVNETPIDIILKEKLSGFTS